MQLGTTWFGQPSSGCVASALLIVQTLALEKLPTTEAEKRDDEHGQPVADVQCSDAREQADEHGGRECP
jgi:hypothetical protein